MEEAARKISEFSQGVGNHPKDLIVSLITQLARNGAKVVCQKVQQHCAVCTQMITNGQELTCGHRAHFQCAQADDWERSDYARSKKCAFCSKIIEVKGIPLQITCWICEQKVLGRSGVILKCGDSKHYYCQPDFIGMVEASLNYDQKLASIVCQKDKCQHPIDRAILKERLPTQIFKQIKE